MVWILGHNIIPWWHSKRTLWDAKRCSGVLPLIGSRVRLRQALQTTVVVWSDWYGPQLRRAPFAGTFSRGPFVAEGWESVSTGVLGDSPGSSCIVLPLPALLPGAEQLVEGPHVAYFLAYLCLAPTGGQDVCTPPPSASSDLDIDSFAGCFKGVSKSVQVLLLVYDQFWY